MADSMTWADVPVANPDDIQTGRNVYIELEEKNGVTMTKASAGKIISCIKEGFMPVLIENDGADMSWKAAGFSLNFPDAAAPSYILGITLDSTILFYSDPSGDLSKPFASIAPAWH